MTTWAGAAEPIRIAMHDMKMPMQGGGMMMDDMKSMGGSQGGAMGSGAPGAMQGGSAAPGAAGPQTPQGGAGAPPSSPGHGAAQPHPTNPVMSVFGDPDRIEGRIAFLRAELGITETQSAAWAQFADALRRSRTHLLEAQAALQESGVRVSSAERLESYERHLAARLESLKGARAGFNQLSAVLDERQKQEAENLLIPFLATF